MTQTLLDVSLDMSRPYPGTPAERAARGKAARRHSPRSAHAAFTAARDRADPVDLLEGQAQHRVPELVPIRYGRMLASPFTFYRGAALIMAADLAETPRSGFEVQCCGDAHLSNFGLFASPERRLLFDINDFDETLPGPWEWDVKRLACSLLIAARNNGLSAKEQERGRAAHCRASYRAAHGELRGDGRRSTSGTCGSRSSRSCGGSRARSVRKMRKRLHKRISKARARDNVQAFAKLTEDVDGDARIVSDPPLIVPARELLPDAARPGLEQRVERFLEAYAATLSERAPAPDGAVPARGHRPQGRRGRQRRHARWIVLLLGRDGDDPLVPAGQGGAGVGARGLRRARVEYDNQGERVVAGQRLMQAASDIFLGWQRVDEGSTACPATSTSGSSATGRARPRSRR